MTDTRTAIGFIGLVLAAFGSWYLATINSGVEEVTTSTERVTRGYYLRSARIFGTGTDGELVYEILAEYAEELPNQTVSFTDVNVRYSDDSNIPWSVDADNALIDPEQPVIQLSGHVTALSSDGFGGNPTEIRTDYLELNPDDFVAETDERVQIRIGQRSLTATGMLASLKDNEVELKSNVSGKFVP
ncbi:MAG: LPS export ABC transporter periplasmic protein LptC [Pseudomonadota bacterium]